jgi:hypothetical protein
MSVFFTSDLEHPLSEDDVSEADRDTQLDIVETWFRLRYEDPAERTPYESAEGGYIWIWGGPYDAREELEGTFSDIVPPDVIDEVVSKLQEECAEWAPTPRREDYDDYFVEDIADITEYYENFTGAILDIEKLLGAEVDGSVKNNLYRLLFVNVITSLETYLSDAFINIVANNAKLMRRFVETTPEFQSQKVPLSEVYKAMEGIERKARGYLADVVWHHLERVKPMYRETLGIEFSGETGPLFRAILTRHDIVHRNGKTKEGNEILVTADDVSNLIQAVEEFVQHIDGQVAKVRLKVRMDAGAGDEAKE